MKKTILIVEDFATSRKVISSFLEGRGYSILQAEDGMEAMKIIEQGAKIDLIITDFNMPRMNGDELVEKVRMLPQYMFIPIFVLSTETNKQKQQRALDANITAWINKPYKIEELTVMIDKVLR
jgi:two-component system, chemotaxis family, chemotaxis protein CheY